MNERHGFVRARIEHRYGDSGIGHFSGLLERRWRHDVKKLLWALKFTATDDVFTRDQVQRMAHRGTHHEWRKHIERCARELMAWTWFVGDVTFNVGVEFAMAVAVGINQYLNLLTYLLTY